MKANSGKALRKGVYRHYKGKEYELIAEGRHSEDPEQFFVVYKGLYSSKEFGKNPVWIRPKALFLEEVILDGKPIPRFKYLRGSSKRKQ
jgi:hypothetical protein